MLQWCKSAIRKSEAMEHDLMKGYTKYLIGDGCDWTFGGEGKNTTNL